MEYTYRIARDTAPDAFIIGNLGAPQISKEYGIKEIKQAIKMIQADALAIHLNTLQECLQNEGEPVYKGIINGLQNIKKEIKIPLIVKETGAGIAKEDIILLKNIGIDAIDISGVGGTSWAAVEYYRSKDKTKNLPEITKTYWDWGIPTAVATIEASTADVNLISSGGIRSGLDIAKAIAIGADLVGISLPFLKAAYQDDYKTLQELMKKFIKELKIAMFLTKSKNLTALKNSNLIISGNTKEWIETRGISVKTYSNRSK